VRLGIENIFVPKSFYKPRHSNVVYANSEGIARILPVLTTLKHMHCHPPDSIRVQNQEHDAVGPRTATSYTSPAIHTTRNMEPTSTKRPQPTPTQASGPHSSQSTYIPLRSLTQTPTSLPRPMLMSSTRSLIPLRSTWSLRGT
jgi:hypothetical protein